MQGNTRLCILLLWISCILMGCSGSGDLLKKVPPTINTVKAGKSYVKQVAVTLAQSPTTAVGKGAGEAYFRSLVEAIADENKRSRLVTPGNSDFPVFMDAPARAPETEPDANTLSREGRRAGFQGIVVASVRDIRVTTIRTGFMWFRKTRFLVQFNVTADLYDPHLAAKVISGVLESQVRISEDDYEGFQNGRVTSIEELDEEIADAGEELGERIGEALADLPWKTTVLGIEGDRIFLPVGSDVGVREGDRLAVFEGRRQLEGKQGERFIAPGYQVGTLQVTAVAGRKAEARITAEEKVQEGDIAVPIR